MNAAVQQTTKHGPASLSTPRPDILTGYLYALFTEQGYGFDRTHAAPDFHCHGLRGDFYVEATTVNPSATPPEVTEDSEAAYFNDYVPTKFGSALYSKLQKKYWDLPHVAGSPLIFAIQDFHAPQAMAWSNSGLVEYLYGIRQVEAKQPDGTSEIVSQKIEKYEWQDKEIPAGFFLQPDSENVSAVLANPGGTLSKFNRMGFLAGFGDRWIGMVRGGICYRRGKLAPESFAAKVHDAGYSETWSEGVSVFHNPNAKHPLPESSILGVAHHTSREGRILASMPDFFPVGSNTLSSCRPRERQSDGQFSALALAGRSHADRSAFSLGRRGTGFPACFVAQVHVEGMREEPHTRTTRVVYT
jgi:hypothetical protein